MNTKLRIALAIAVFTAIILAGMGAPAWADRLALSVPEPAGLEQQSSQPAGSRPKGTVITTEPVIPVTQGGKLYTVGSCATVLVDSPPAGVEYFASVVPADQLPEELPGNLASCAIKVEAKPGDTLASMAIVCFPVPPTQAGFAYSWDGVAWVETTLLPQDGQSCVEIAATAGNPAFAALFDQ